MSGAIEARLRQFLLAVAGAMCLGTIVELALADHTQAPLQWAPFILSGLGLIALAAFWFRPAPGTLWALRVVLVLIALGGVIGVLAHLNGNREFVLETRPQADALTTLWLSLRGGAPALAPGILAVTAALAGAATWRHPVLTQRRG